MLVALSAVSLLTMILVHPWVLMYVVCSYSPSTNPNNHSAILLVVGKSYLDVSHSAGVPTGVSKMSMILKCTLEFDVDVDDCLG